MVTHSLNLVRTMCDEAAWFDHGKLMTIGTGGEVVQAYISQVDEAEAERLEVADDRARLAAEADLAVSQFPVGSNDRLVRLGEVLLLGADGEPTVLATAGESLTIRLHYRCASPAERPLFSFAVLDEQGRAGRQPDHAAQSPRREDLRRGRHHRLHDRAARSHRRGVPDHDRCARQPGHEGLRQA